MVSRDRYGRPNIKAAGDQDPYVASNNQLVGGGVMDPSYSIEVSGDAVAKLKFEEEHPDTLVIQCSDGRYTSIVSELMKNNGVLRYDVMAMPGGPALLDMASASILQSEACKAGTSFLIKGHKTKNIWLLAHQGCGYYKYNLQGMPQHIVEERQASDLQRSANYLHSVNSDIKIYATYIVQENGLVSFKSIELE